MRRFPVMCVALRAILQNTRYVVTSGARQKDEEWDPEENGGFSIHGAFESS